MMNDANLDHLLQITLPRANWPGSSLGAERDDRPVFDDHLAQASAPRAPVEPPRPPATRAPENRPPNDRLPSQGEGTRSEVEERNHAPAAAPEDDDNRTSEEISKESPAAEKPQGEIVGTDRGTEEADGSAHSENGGDHDKEDEESTQTAGLAESAVAALTVVSQSQQEISADNEAAELSSGEQPTEASAKKVLATQPRKSTDSSLPTTPTVDPTKSEVVLEDATTPAAADAEQTFPAKARPADNQQQIDVARPTSKIADSAASQHAASEPSAVTAKRQQIGDHENESSGDLHATVNPEELQKSDTATRAERSAAKTDKSADESRESAISHGAADRQSLNSNTPNSAGNAQPAAAVQAVMPDVSHDLAKPDATDESLGPKAPHSSRGGGLTDPLAKLHRGGAVVARGQRDAKSDEAPRVDATRFVSRVAKAFHTAQERGGTLQLRLSPPELGAMRLELLVQDGVLAAKLETETPAARRVLLDHLPLLRDRLAEQNIRIERFDVDVRQEGGGHSQPSPHEQRQQQPQNGSPHRQPTRHPVPAAESISSTPAAIGLTTDTQINLVA